MARGASHQRRGRPVNGYEQTPAAAAHHVLPGLGSRTPLLCRPHLYQARAQAGRHGRPIAGTGLRLGRRPRAQLASHGIQRASGQQGQRLQVVSQRPRLYRRHVALGAGPAVQKLESPVRDPSAPNRSGHGARRRALVGNGDARYAGGLRAGGRPSGRRPVAHDARYKPLPSVDAGAHSLSRPLSRSLRLQLDDAGRRDPCGANDDG